MREKKSIEIDDGDCKAMRMTVYGSNISIETDGVCIVLLINDSAIHFEFARWAEMDGQRYEVSV